MGSIRDYRPKSAFVLESLLLLFIQQMFLYAYSGAKRILGAGYTKVHKTDKVLPSWALLKSDIKQINI